MTTDTGMLYSSEAKNMFLSSGFLHDRRVLNTDQI